MKRRTPTRGFTLVELMVVIVIIAILAALTIPGFLRFRMMANERNCSATLRNLNVANAQFQNGNMDGSGQSSYWTGDIAGLYFVQTGDVDPASYRPVKAISDQTVALADLAPLPRGTYDGAFHNGLPAGAPANPKSGYWYVMIQAFRDPTTGGTGEAHGDAYGICAVPARVGRTGEHIYITNEESTVHYRNVADVSAETVFDEGEYAKIDADLPDWPENELPWTMMQ